MNSPARALAQAEVRAAMEKVRGANATALDGVLAACAFSIGQLVAHLEVDRAAGQLFSACLERAGPIDHQAVIETIRANCLRGFTELRNPGLSSEVLRHVGKKEVEDPPEPEPVPPVAKTVTVAPEVPTSSTFSGFQTKLRLGRHRTLPGS